MPKSQMNRRDFMKFTAAAASAAAAGNTLFTPQAALAARAVRQQNLASHITLGNTSIQSNINPYFFAYFQSDQVYDTLLELSPNGEILPDLATEWNRVDGQTLEIRMREDVFFSNGERLTARHVQRTMEHLLTVGIANLGLYGIPVSDFQLFPPQFALFNLESFEVVDDLNLVVRTTRPDVLLEKRLTRMFILSEQSLEEENLSTQAIGTGYFQVVEYIPGERIDYEIFEGNWRGEFPVRTATYVRVGDPRAALEAGDIDVAQSVAPDIARTLVDSGNWNVSSKPALGCQVISMRSDSNPALGDVRVRRALNLAIDNEAYAEIVLAGFGSPSDGQLLQEGIDGYNPELSDYGFDPAEAMRLLREAGHQNLTVSMGAANTQRAQAEVIAGFLEAVGVRVELETPDSGTIINELLNGGPRDMLFFNQFYTTLADWSQAMIALYSPAPNAPRYIDSERFYELNGQIQFATDVEVRNELIQECAAVMNEEASLLFLAYTDFYFVHTPAIETLPINLDNSPRIYAIEKVED